MASYKVFAGSLIGFLYNKGFSHIPSRTLRKLYLKFWLGALGKKANIQMDCKFLNGRKIFLGDRNVVNFGCLLDGRRYKIVTGSNVSIGPEATILTLGHDPKSTDFSDRGGDVVIGSHVWIAYRAIILPDVTIGEGAVIGAGSVVSKSVEPYCIVAGNPARVVGERPRDLNYKINYSPWMY